MSEKKAATQESLTVKKGQTSYLEAVKRAQEAGKVRTPTYTIHSWATDGSQLLGRVMKVSEFTGGKFEQPVKSYLIETDDGVKSCILGTYTDSQLEGETVVGKIVLITHEGRKDLEDGRKVNIFNVQIFEEVS